MATIYEKVGKMVNAVRKVSGEYYQSIVPIFKAEDSENPNPEFKQFGNIITENSLIMNQFLQGFQDVILYESFRIHMFDNEFSRRFKKESNPLRRATFETFVNPVNPLQYDGEALDRILKLYPRDVKRVTYVRNREDIFPVSIDIELAMSAFQSMEAFYDFYQQQYIALQNSNAIVEFNDIKQCFNANYASGALKVINIHGKTPKEISALLREIITRMTKPSSDFNNYINLEGATGDPVITNTPKESIVFMPDSKTLAQLDTDVLAGAYNMEYAEVTKNILAVDDWGYNVYDRTNQTILRHETSKIKAVLCDEYTLKFDEHLKQQMTGLNGASLTEQRFYHVWQTIALRPFCNCIVLVDDGEEPVPVEEFKIVVPENGFTFENKSFVADYTGDLPENIESADACSFNVFEGDLDTTTYNNPNTLFFSITNIDKENKKITFEINPESVGYSNITEITFNHACALVVFDLGDNPPTTLEAVYTAVIENQNKLLVIPV
ncbi:MAG: hypothetical protein IKG27_05750 [Bacilli bacterium]|nr:hypothetical protein [Bacilli bacterium]